MVATAISGAAVVAGQRSGNAEFASGFFLSRRCISVVDPAHQQGVIVIGWLTWRQAQTCSPEIGTFTFTSSSLERPTGKLLHAVGTCCRGVPMPNRELLERARMFEERAKRAIDPISRQHYRETAAHYRALS
jgi:hypothetical protein